MQRKRIISVILLIVGIAILVIGILLNNKKTVQDNSNKTETTFTYNCTLPDEKQTSTIDGEQISFTIKNSYKFIYKNNEIGFGEKIITYYLNDSSYLDKITWVENNSNIKPDLIKTDSKLNTKTYTWYMNVLDINEFNNLDEYIISLENLKYTCKKIET